MPVTEQYVVVASGRIMVAITLGPDGVTVEHGTGRVTIPCSAPQMAHTPKGRRLSPSTNALTTSRRQVAETVRAMGTEPLCGCTSTSQ